MTNDEKKKGPKHIREFWTFVLLTIWICLRFDAWYLELASEQCLPA
jgi:hypothetical protein